MMAYARLDQQTVVEVIVVPEGTAISDMFHPDFVAALVPCPEGVASGWTYSEADGFRAPVVVAQDIEQIKLALKASIDSAAEIERLRYITAGTGQAMTYQRKVEEAQTLKASIAFDPEYVPDVATYPMLSATVGIDGDTLADVAQVVLDMDAQWALVGAAIEHARMSAKAAIDAAGDEEAARAVVPAWPAPMPT